VLNSLSSIDAQRGYRHAIEELIEWSAWSAIAPRLKKGANQVGVKVKGNDGGWAAAADPAALSGPALAAEGR
jgi:hypothetical protein